MRLLITSVLINSTSVSLKGRCGCPKKSTFSGTPASHTALWGRADLIRHITQNAELIGQFSKFNRLNIKYRSLFRHDRSHRLLLRSFNSFFFFLHRRKRIRREVNKIFFIRMLPTLMLSPRTPSPPPRPCDSGPFTSGFLNSLQIFNTSFI